MSGEVVVLGVGAHSFGKFPGKSFVDLGVYACREALKDAQIEWTDVQTMATSVDSFTGTAGRSSGLLIEQAMGNTGIPNPGMSNACATGGSCLRVLYSTIASGMCDIGIAVGASVSPVGFFPPTPVQVDSPWDTNEIRFRAIGAPNPVFWALEATRRMHDYGTTEVHLAKIKVKNSKAGSLNPLARYRRTFTLEEVLNSPMVCYPLRLLEICATSDGAAAVVLCSSEVAKRYTNRPITLAACSLASPLFGDPSIEIPLISCSEKPSVPAISEVGIAARMAFGQAGLGPEDLSFLEICDNSSWHELAYLEKIGICGTGEAELLIDEGATELGGRIPVCPSGGFSSFGEAVPAMGIWHACEITWQLRGQAGPRQIENAKVGYGQCMGLYGNNAAIILKK